MFNNEYNDLITIIVGIYNGERYLKECIDSIINQSYKNLEILLVNDGSTDNSLNIIESYLKNDNRIKLINQDNSGVSASRNNAIDASTGDYICIMDQDDILDKEYVNYFLKLIKETNADIATSPQPDKFFDKVHIVTLKDEYSIITGKDATIEMLYHNFVIAPWNKMISKKLIDKNNIRFNPKFYGGEGYAFSIECFQNASKVVVCQDKIYHYRVGDPTTGASKYNEATINSSIEAEIYIKNKLLFDDEKTIKAWEFSNWHSYCDCFNMMVGCSAKKKNIVLYNKLKKYCRENAYVAFHAPISKQQKLRGYLFKISPYVAARIINRFRVRKFKKVN